MDIKMMENIEREDPSQKTLALLNRWRKITKPGDYRYTQDIGKDTTAQEH